MTPAALDALDALAAWLLADTVIDTGGPNYEPLRVPPSTKRLEIEAALSALRAQVETLAADLDKTRRLHGKHILDASSQITRLESRLLSADTARASAEAALARVSAQVTVLTEAHSAASAMNRSAWEIAERNGEQTNWPAFRTQLLHALETSHEALNLLAARPEKTP